MKAFISIWIRSECAGELIAYAVDVYDYGIVSQVLHPEAEQDDISGRRVPDGHLKHTVLFRGDLIAVAALLYRQTAGKILGCDVGRIISEVFRFRSSFL